MGKGYEYAPEVEFPNLFFEVSTGLLDLVKGFNIDYTKAELCFMRKQILDSLKKIGISQENYDHYEHYSFHKEMAFIALNNLYGTNYCLADLPRAPRSLKS